MWLHTISLCGLLGVLSTAAFDVKLTCIHGCVPNTQGIVAYAGTDIKLKYTVDDALCVLEVKFKGKLIISTFEPDLCRLDVRAVIGRDSRVEYLSDLVRDGNKFVYEFRLRDVSLLDNGASFDYVTDLKDINGKNVTGFDMIRVMKAPPTQRPTTTTEKPTTTTEDPTTPTMSTTPAPDNVKISTNKAGDVKSTTDQPSTTDIYVVQVGAATSTDDYPWPAVIGIICGSVFVILFVIIVLLAFRCRRSEQKPEFRSPTTKTEEGEVGTSVAAGKPSDESTENGKIAVSESQPLFAEIEHGVAPSTDTVKSEPNGDVKNGDINGALPPPLEEDDIFVQFEQGAAPGNPALVYTSPDEIEAEDDKPRFASLSNQPITVIDDLEDYQLNLDSKLLNENNELIDDSSDSEQPHVGYMKPKPPSDVIEPPIDVLDVDVHEASNDVFEGNDDGDKPVLCDVIINEPVLVDTEIDVDHLVSV